MPLTDVQLSPRKASLLLSQEIRRLQFRLERLEHGMEAFYAAGGASLGTVAITALQELDMLAQSTDALATYVEKLSSRFADDTRVDLTPELSQVPLRELRSRLAGRHLEELSANAPELF
ncbi:MAG: chemotaxis protein [Salipiger thiooxidans]|uniref:chemotaxis protein n=1 Tax=Salipiger thiooxidans TaxID=282683 RepID=UPI001CF98F36|nr:chemotaxis protein [Salipiger thiooxidans]